MSLDTWCSFDKITGRFISSGIAALLSPPPTLSTPSINTGGRKETSQRYIIFSVPLPFLVLISLIRVGQAQAVFKPVLSVEPNSPQIFRGETVTLTCRISGGNGSYYWYKDGGYSHRSAENYYIINVGQSHKYSCYGSIDGRFTTDSNEVSLSVIERPKAVLTLQPDGQIFSGQEVTFTCEIRGHADTEWMYNWNKDGVQISSYTESRKYSFTPVESLGAKYTCSGRRKSDSQTSETSNTVTLTVSEKPKPTVRVNPQSSVYTGDRVTLNCNLLSNGWTFLWYKDRVQVAEDTNTLHDTVSNAGETVYQCKARRGNYDSELSDTVTVTVRALPKPVVSINPDEQVYRGETVTLRCDIQDEEDSDWIYSWNKDGSGVSSEQEYRISSAETSHAGKYTCRGRERGGSHSSHTSDAVTLTVSDAAEAVVSVSPLRWLTEGDSVTLSCEVKHSSTGWTFSWYTEVPSRDSQGSLRYSTALLSDSSRRSGGSYTLSPVTVKHTGVYMCRAERGEPVFHTRDSNLQPLWITASESPPVSLIINPSRTQHFTADSLSLSCEDQSDSTGWTVRGYTHSETVSDCSSVSGSTCNISSLSTSHTGVYWCQSESGGRSNPVNITVHHGHVILDSPVHPVTEGHPLTLHCLSRNSKTSASGVDFYKDGSVLQNKTTGEMTISTVSKSDEGFYHCKHPERGESPKSWVSVRDSGSGSSIDIVFVAVGLSLALLFIILLLILRWWHKSIKGKDRDIQQNSNQTPGQNPSQSGAEDSQSGHTPLQTDVHIYAAVENTSDSAAELSGAVYTQVMKKKESYKNKDDDAGLSDVIYTELQLMPQKKAKKNQVKASVEYETVYSQLKQST
ncbi:carcinoembryonic antigen-related cell adhesion molecule 5-like [Ictalurus furcatus]|uniref:carcinoembryonic antigen-related cell adhesion molecule 5-like n=1 Tax=Ictalurus furcatus TaxID=66913 RepID=UPI002350DF47|nr:carcinoembryonic antigen-related cell adhesion molecule 5-like [Ictalurus furcatus]